MALVFDTNHLSVIFAPLEFKNNLPTVGQLQITDDCVSFTADEGGPW